MTDHDNPETEPSVPDVAGSPIRVGQLVEGVHTGAIGRTSVVNPDPTFYGLPCIQLEHLPGWRKAKDWRVVTDLFRPPEPETRDVVLRVTVEADATTSRDAVREDVREALYQGGTVDADWACVTVEVVE